MRNRIQQIPDASTAKGGNGERFAKTERIELAQNLLLLFAISLVHDQQHRLLRTPQHLRDLTVRGKETRLPIHDEQHQLCFLYGNLRLLADRGFHDIF